MPAVTPEVPSSIMLPIAATGLIAVASALAYRRRRHGGVA
jgi:MYXO-CTERM domain-containing protein